MKITITTSAEDADALSGFAAATGWTDKSGMTQEDWIKDKVSFWVMTQARLGSANAATATARASYTQALLAARQAATVRIPKPSTDLVASAGGTPLLK